MPKAPGCAKKSCNYLQKKCKVMSCRNQILKKGAHTEHFPEKNLKQPLARRESGEGLERMELFLPVAIHGAPFLKLK